MLKCLGFAIALTFVVPGIRAEDQGSSAPTLSQLKFTTPAYQQEALRLLIEEANDVAREVRLAEDLPITKSNIVEKFICPPRMATVVGLGNITTRHYSYFVAVGHKFSSLVIKDLNEKVALQRDYHLPMSRNDTNAVLEMVSRLLSAVGMDVAGLKRDCTANVDFYVPEGPQRAKFVPLYWVTWQGGGRAVLSIEFFEPTKTILQLRVEDPHYNLRKPVEVRNVEELLAQTNAPSGKGAGL